MNKMTKLLAPVLSLTLLTGVFIALQGCEKDKNTNDNGDLDTFFEGHPYVSDPRDNPGTGIVQVSPSAASIGTEHQQIGFTVRGGVGPYHWDTADHNVGLAAGTGDQNGVYTATVIGNNSVIVWDRNGNAAIALINGTSSSLAITPSSVTLAANGDVVTLTVTGGTPTYEWSLAYPTGDFGPGITTATGATVTYRRTGSGKNVVKVMDYQHRLASIEIQQPTVTPLAIIPPGPVDLSWGETLQFNGSGGTPPYFYTVNATGKGTITSTGFYTATTNTAVHGSNQVTVWDSLGGTVSATVNLP